MCMAHLKRWVLSLARNCSRLMVKERRWSNNPLVIYIEGRFTNLVVRTYTSPAKILFSLLSLTRLVVGVAGARAGATTASLTPP